MALKNWLWSAGALLAVTGGLLIFALQRGDPAQFSVNGESKVLRLNGRSFIECARAVATVEGVTVQYEDRVRVLLDVTGLQLGPEVGGEVQLRPEDSLEVSLSWLNSAKPKRPGEVAPALAKLTAAVSDACPEKRQGS